MTDPEMADVTYIEPDYVADGGKIIAKSVLTRFCLPWAVRLR